MKRLRKLFVLLFIFSLISITFIGLFEFQTTDRSIPEEIPLTSAAILIDGNAQLAAANMSAGADGTESNPYVIRDQVINGGGNPCISISNTDAHFVIKNCTVYNGGSGIYFYNVENGRVINNTARDTSDYYLGGIGILLRGSRYNTVANNTVYNMDGIGDPYSGTGIMVYQSSINNTLTGNIIYANSGGLGGMGENSGNGISLITDCENNTVDGNIIHSNVATGDSVRCGNGILLYDNCDQNTLINNIIYNNSGAVEENSGNGIALRSSCDGNTLKGNIIYNNTVHPNPDSSGCGISLRQSCYDNLMISNILANNSRAGIFLGLNCDRTRIIQNLIKFNADFGVNVNISTTDDTFIYYNMFCKNSNGSILVSDQIGDWGINTIILANIYECDESDYDNDGLFNWEEVLLGTQIYSIDSDNDGLNDTAEVQLYSTSAIHPDSDGDGLSDGIEVLTLGTDATNADTDGDGLSDGGEVLTLGTNATNTDSDGYSDGAEVAAGTDPLNPRDYLGLISPPDDALLFVFLLATVLGVYGAVITVAFLKKGPKAGKNLSK